MDGGIGPTSSSTYNVASHSTNPRDGGTDQVFKTINRCLAAMSAGDSCLIRGSWGSFDGVYDESISLGAYPAGTSIDNRTTIAGYLNENPIMRPTKNAGPYGYAIVTFSDWDSPNTGAYLQLSDFTVDMILAPNAPPGIEGEVADCGEINASFVLVLRMTCLNAGHDGWVVSGGPAPSPRNQIWRDNVVKDCGRISRSAENTKGIGIHISAGTDHLIEGNIIEGCRAGGIAVHQSASLNNVTIRNNVIRQVGTDSTWPRHPGHSTQVSAGILVGHGTNFYISDNLIYNAGSDADPDGADTCFFSWGDNSAWPDGAFFNNNTCHMGGSATSYGFQTGDGPGANHVAVNNIFSSVDVVTDIHFTGAGNSNSDFVTDLIFVDAPNGDYRLCEGLDIATANCTAISRAPN